MKLKEIKEIAGQITFVMEGVVKAEPKLPPPKVGPGYLRDWSARMQSKEELPVPKGETKSNHHTVSWVAHREAERMEDPAILPQVAERLQNLQSAEELPDLSFLLVHFIKNTGSKAGAKLLGQLLQQVPPKRSLVEELFWTLEYAPTPEVRAFALKHVPHKSWDIEGSALQVLTAAANPKDFNMLSGLLLSDKLHDSNYVYCVEATAATGKKRAVPVLKRFIETHGKNRKSFFRDAVGEAEEAIGAANTGSK